jgi:hypothetical protein
VPETGTSGTVPEGVFSWELFSPADAQKLQDLVEEWDAHYRENSTAYKAGVWSQEDSNVDARPENIFWLFGEEPDRVGPPSYHTKGWRPSAAKAEAQVARPFAPLVRSLCMNVFEPFLRNHFGKNEHTTCKGVWFRRYFPTGRTRIVAHEDRDHFTFNVAVSDKTSHKGGNLYMCNLMPHNFQAFLSQKVDEENEQRPRWLEVFEPYKTLEAKKFGEDTCALRQGEQGRVVGHHAERLHGVQHITEGMRVSLIFFMGNPAYAEQESMPPAQKLRHMQSRHLEAYLNVMENMALWDSAGVDFPTHPMRDHRQVEVFHNDVLPALEAPRIQESAEWTVRLLRLASSMLVPDFDAHESVLDKRRANAPRVQGALLAILKQHGKNESLVAEACGVMERLQCAGGGCGEAAALCSDRNLVLPEARQAVREPGALEVLHERCKTAFDAAAAVELTEDIDPACAKLWSIDWRRQPPPEGPERGEEL